MVVNYSEFSSLLLDTSISEGLSPDLGSHVSVVDFCIQQDLLLCRSKDSRVLRISWGSQG